VIDMAEHHDGANAGELRLLPCRNLRTRACYSEPRDDMYEYGAETDTVVFWCLETMKEIGPDGDICEPDLCGPDRPCCVPVERPKLE